MSRSKKKSKHSKLERMDVTIQVTPFGLFALNGRDILKKEVWNGINAPKKYMTWEDGVKKFKAKLSLNAKYTLKKIFASDAENLAKEYGIKFNFQKFMIDLTKLKIKEGFSKDKLISQASGTMDGTNKSINIFYEKLMEWYGHYWPESSEKIDSISGLIDAIKTERVGQSMGFDFREEDISIMRLVGKELESLVNFKKTLLKYIENLMSTVAPNISNVAGYIIGAKLITSAGSIRKLAEMPSSTIQVLGAEKALFRHLRKGTKPPKYGILLSHEAMHKINSKNRGKFARFLASKISIAAKLDYFSKGDIAINKRLAEEIDRKIEELA